MDQSVGPILDDSAHETNVRSEVARLIVRGKALFRQADEADDEGRDVEANCQAAIDLFEQALKLEPKNWEAHQYKGRALLLLDRREDALLAFNQAIASDSSKWRPYFWKAYALDDMDRPEDALEWISKAIEIRPRRADALFNRALLYQRLGRHQPAVDDFNAVVHLTPNDPDAYSSLAYSLNCLGRSRQAMDRVTKALLLRDQDWEAWGIYGFICVSLADSSDDDDYFHEALHAFDRSFALEPEKIDSGQHEFVANMNLQRGYAFGSLSNFKQARQAFERCVEDGPAHAKAPFLAKINLRRLARRLERQWQPPTWLFSVMLWAVAVVVVYEGYLEYRGVVTGATFATLIISMLVGILALASLPVLTKLKLGSVELEKQASNPKSGKVTLDKVE